MNHTKFNVNVLNILKKIFKKGTAAYRIFSNIVLFAITAVFCSYFLQVCSDDADAPNIFCFFRIFSILCLITQAYCNITNQGTYIHTGCCLKIKNIKSTNYLVISFIIICYV